MRNLPKSILKTTMILLGTLFLVIVLLLGGIAMWLQTDAARQQIFQLGIEILQEKLQTKVKADSISIELLKSQVRMYGMTVNDREDSLLLGIGELHVGISPYELLDRRVCVTDVELRNADARLWRDSLTSNYQFLIDAFKAKHRSSKKKKEGASSKMQLIIDIDEVNIEKLHARWDVRHKPRKNIGRPNRGAFDANHVDVILSTKAKVKSSGKDTYKVHIKDFDANDISSGFHVNSLSARALISKDKVEVSELRIGMHNSNLSASPFTINLKKKDIATAFTLKAKIVLQDIAKPFAPVLSNFTTPLELTTQVSGPLRRLNVEDIHIQTPDKRLTLTAHGTLDGLFGKKEGLNLQFRNIEMSARDSIKEQIVMHFAKKMRLKMIRQMKALGNIRFKGSLDVLYKREIIDGKLFTPHGNLTTRFTIDGKTRYMNGYLRTASFDMGKVMNIKGIGAVKCNINFNVNTSKKTPRPATALPHGRLPMGTITAEVFDTRYSSICIPMIRIDLVSDGSTARGKLWSPDGLDQMIADVRYIQTDSQQRVWFRLSDGAQQWLLKESVEMLKEKLHADVEVDSVSLHFFQGSARLYGLRVKDRKQMPMLSLDSLHVSLDAQELLAHKVHVTHLGIYGLKAQLNKDSVDANFRFIQQSLKKSAKKRGHTARKKKRLQLVLNLKELHIEDMQVKWDNLEKPRKNLGKPHRGAFDLNHIDVLLNLNAGIRQMSDGYVIDLRKMSLYDRASGLKIDSVHTHAIWRKGQLQIIDGLYVKLPQSWIRTDPFTVNLKKKRLDHPFGLTAHVVLQDIAMPFAPVLSNFTTPIDMHTVISGQIDAIRADDIDIHTADEKLKLTAQGLIRGISEPKDSLNLRFRDIDFSTDNETLMTLVMHFAKTMRLKMIRQMSNIGDIHFTGDLDILHKREKFAGRLDTSYGSIETDFVLDGKTHYMTGYLDASALDVSKLLNLRRLGAVNVHADFDFNISSKTPRPATALPNGRLPQGHINAYIYGAKFGILHAKQIEAVVNSDGSTATGTIVMPKKILDIIFDFSYIQTDEQQHLKFRPKYKLHWFKKKKRKHIHDHNRKEP